MNYIHTYIHTYMHTYITYTHTYITCIHNIRNAQRRSASALSERPRPLPEGALLVALQDARDDLRAVGVCGYTQSRVRL